MTVNQEDKVERSKQIKKSKGYCDITHITKSG